MASNPVEVKKAAQSPAPAPVPDFWQSFRSEMENVFDRFGFGPKAMRTWFDMPRAANLVTKFEMASPAIDIVEDPKEYRLTAELPGMSEKDIELVVSGDMLTLKGEKKQETERKEKNYTLSERCYGSFERSFWLPEGVDRDKIAADFAKGVLTVTLPKTAAAIVEPKKIDVKSAA